MDKIVPSILGFYLPEHIGVEVIADGILISTSLYYLVLWGGTKKGVSQVTSKIHNFMWLRSTQCSHAGVAWITYCLTKEKGDLNLLDPSKVISTLMVKWLVTACKPGMSNFNSMLHYRLLSFQPHPKDQ